MSDTVTFYIVVLTTVLQIIFGILQLKLAALTFTAQFFDLYLSLLLLTGVFILIEQSIQTACINILNESKAEALTNKNIITLLSSLVFAYMMVILLFLIYAQSNFQSTSTSSLMLIIFVFACKSCVIVISNIFAAKRKIITEKIIKLSSSFSITLAFFICWIYELDDFTSIFIVLFSALAGLFVVITYTKYHVVSYRGEQDPILREIVSTLQYLLPGSVYVLILPAAVSMLGTTNDKAALAILRQIILAGSSLVLSPTTSYLILFVNTLRRASNRKELVKRVNKFLSIIVLLVFSGALLTLINFDWIFYFFVGHTPQYSPFFLISIITFYYLELVQNVLANLCVNLREYKTGLQIIIVCFLSMSTFYFLADALFVSILLFSTYTLFGISAKILYLVQRHITVVYDPLVLYISGAGILFLISQSSFSKTAELMLTFIGVILGLHLYVKLKKEFQYIREMNRTLDD